MPKFVFIGGKQPAEAIHTDPEGRVTLNEATDPTDTPPICYAFGLQFQMGVPVDVTPDKFKSREAYENVLRRIQTNRFFKAFADDADYVDVPAEPKRKPGRPKVIAAPAEEVSPE